MVDKTIIFTLQILCQKDSRKAIPKTSKHNVSRAWWAGQVFGAKEKSVKRTKSHSCVGHIANRTNRMHNTEYTHPTIDISSLKTIVLKNGTFSMKDEKVIKIGSCLCGITEKPLLFSATTGHDI